RPFCFCLRPSHGLAGAGARVSGSGGLSGRQSRRLGRVPAREGGKPAQEIPPSVWLGRKEQFPPRAASRRERATQRFRSIAGRGRQMVVLPFSPTGKNPANSSFT